MWGLQFFGDLLQNLAGINQVGDKIDFFGELLAHHFHSGPGIVQKGQGVGSGFQLPVHVLEGLFLFKISQKGC